MLLMKTDETVTEMRERQGKENRIKERGDRNGS